jgi:hypothetical protein
MNNLKNAINEAERFIKKANEFIEVENNKEKRHYLNPKESGAVKRASLDLTRALAKYRKDWRN